MAVSDHRRKKIQAVVQARQRGIIVVLEDIHDPHNLAAILRSCDAFGIQDVYCIYEKETYVNPKKVGRASSSSANKWLDFEIFRSSAECIKVLKKKKYRIIATALSDTARSIIEMNFLQTPIALVFGNEHSGVSATIFAAAVEHLIIPMRGMVQSLNVSVTAAICLYEVTRQRMMSGKNFLLSAKEQKRLMKDFLGR